jgi:hypothetical protein
MTERHQSGADERLDVERFLRTSAQYLGLPAPECAAPPRVSDAQAYMSMQNALDG